MNSPGLKSDCTYLLIKVTIILGIYNHGRRLIIFIWSHTAYVRSATKVFLNSSIIAQVICQMLYSFSQLIVHFFYIFRLKVQIDVKWGRWKLLYQNGWGAQIRTLPLPYILPLVVLLNINSIGSKRDCFFKWGLFSMFCKKWGLF